MDPAAIMGVMQILDASQQRRGQTKEAITDGTFERPEIVPEQWPKINNAHGNPFLASKLYEVDDDENDHSQSNK